MKRTLALGGVAAGLLASAAIATPAHAAGDVATTTLASTNLAAQQVAAFWYGENKANLINATPYNVETKVVAKHVSKGGPSADTKPGVVPAIGDEKKSTSKSKNVNLPKTTGKVFFIGADGHPHWCTATSVQSHYRNLVATAGHCVYDTESNEATLDKWVFIPGYYQGKTPWGIYVGKQAFTHYDYDVYEDGDRNYAFVTVYNGVLPTAASFDKHYESRIYRSKWDAYKAKKRLEQDKSTGWSHLKVVHVKKVVKVGTWGSHIENIKVHEFAALNKHRKLTGHGPWALGTGVKTDELTAEQYNSDKDWYVSPDGKQLFFRVKTGHGHHHNDALEAPTSSPSPSAVESEVPAVTSSPAPSPAESTTPPPPNGDEYKYFKRTFWANYIQGYQVVGKKLSIGLKDVGRLGDNVGGQGLAYNQKIGSSVFVFGYPSGRHIDGNQAFTGQTLKWSYGKTFAAQASAVKAEELVGVKSSFTGEGAIGSSWLLQYKSARRLGYLNGVTIGVADTDKNDRIDTSVSPYFDGETYGVYKAAANLWSGKIV